VVECLYAHSRLQPFAPRLSFSLTISPESVNGQARNLLAAIVGAAAIVGCANRPGWDPKAQTPAFDPNSVTVSNCADMSTGQPEPRALALRILGQTEPGVWSCTEAVAGEQAKFEAVSRTMVQKAIRSNLESTSLLRILQALKLESQGRHFSLPVAAYSATLNDEPVWVVVRKWGIAGNRDHYVVLEGVEADVFSQKSLERLGYATCD
jgi:hypothetical protein